MFKFLKIIFHISTLFLIIISLYPGSLLGLLVFGDINDEPNLAYNPYFTPIPKHLYTFASVFNHFISYVFISLLGFFLYLKNEYFKKIFYGLFFLSIILEVLHIIVPNRSFQLVDLIANILGVLVAYFVVKIYLLYKS